MHSSGPPTQDPPVLTPTPCPHKQRRAARRRGRARHRDHSVCLAWARICRRSSLADVGSIVQVSKGKLTGRALRIDLLQMAKRIGLQCDTAEHEDLSREKSLTLDRVDVDDWRSHRALERRHRGTLNQSTNVSVKTGGSRVGGPNLCI